MRTKKSVRNQLHTQAFFGQVAQASGGCPCGDESCKVSKPERESTGTSRPERTTAMEAACKVFEQMTESLDEMSLLEESSGLVEADRVNIAGTFELVDIEGNIAHIDNVGLYFDRVLCSKLDSIYEKTRDVEMMAAGTGNQLAELDKIIAQSQAWTELINFAACSVQLFNVEKRFGFFEQDYRHIRYHAEAWAHESPQKDPPTLRQIFECPMQPKATVERTKKPKERKKRDINAILGDRSRLGKLAVKETQALNKLVPDQETQLPSLPVAVTYDGVEISDAFPEAVRQSAYDLTFSNEEIHGMEVELMMLRETIRRTMLIWVTTSRKAWEYGSTHIHEFPDMRRYEHVRTALQALYVVAFRTASKLFTYFCTEDRRQGLCPKLEAYFVKFERNPEKMKEEWDRRVTRAKDSFLSVEELLEHMRPFCATHDEDWKPDEGWNKLPTKK
ncbi:hypothetical protein MMC22_010909 [Lobaria immixta]|nr:hypothetical protein [Lobaria immixta]